MRGVLEETAALPAVLLTGGPGAGKTTVGRALARRLGAALVDQDVVTEPLVAVVADLVGVRDLDDARLAGRTRQARYETVVAVAEDNLRVGRPVVLVAPFTAERGDARAWSAVEGRLRGAGGSPLLVWLRLDPDAALRRLKARGAARDRVKAHRPASSMAQGLVAPVGPHLTVDAECPVDDIVAAVLAALTDRPVD